MNKNRATLRSLYLDIIARQIRAVPKGSSRCDVEGQRGTAARPDRADPKVRIWEGGAGCQSAHKHRERPSLGRRGYTDQPCRHGDGGWWWRKRAGGKRGMMSTPVHTVIVASGTHSSSSLKVNHSPTLSGHSPAVLPPADFSSEHGNRLRHQIASSSQNPTSAAGEHTARRCLGGCNGTENRVGATIGQGCNLELPHLRPAGRGRARCANRLTCSRSRGICHHCSCI